MARLLESTFDKDPVKACAFDGHVKALEAFAKRFEDSWTPQARAQALIGAIQGGQEACAVWLLGQGANPWMREAQEQEPPYSSAESAGGGDWHALHWAAAEGAVWAMRLLAKESGFEAAIGAESFAGLAAMSGQHQALELALAWLSKSEPEEALARARQDMLLCEDGGGEGALQALREFCASMECLALANTAATGSAQAKTAKGL